MHLPCTMILALLSIVLFHLYYQIDPRGEQISHCTTACLLLWCDHSKCFVCCRNRMKLNSIRRGWRQRIPFWRSFQNMEVNLHNLVFGYAILCVLLSYKSCKWSRDVAFCVLRWFCLCNLGTSWFMFGKHWRIVFLCLSWIGGECYWLG